MKNDRRYNWFEDDFVSYLYSIKLPAFRKEKAIRDSITEEKKRIIDGLYEAVSKNQIRLFSEEFYIEIGKSVKTTSDIFGLLVKVIDYYNNSDMAKAQMVFDQIMSKLEEHLFISNLRFPSPYQSRLFRIRSSPDKALKEPREMFHVSYKERHLISNERYSLAGHPCLYLSSQLHIAWQECGYPHRFYYSEFQYQETSDIMNYWRFICFLSPTQFIKQFFVIKNNPESYYSKLACDYIISYPLIFACSIVNLNGHTAFKQEYIISQMLTQWVYRNYDNGLIRGIKYFPCNNADEDRRFTGFNVVLPAKYYDNRGYSKDLIEKFLVSKPRVYENILAGNEYDKVKDYKDDLVFAMSNVQEPASNCLLEIYRIVDLLEKTMRLSNETDMNYIMSTVRNIILHAELLIEKYKKADIKQQCLQSNSYTTYLGSNIELFSTMYDRFNNEILEIARIMYSVFDQENTTSEEFFSI